jgi:tRNA-dihydrouridine synthase B
MDGYTDAAFRRVVAMHGKPDVMFTEFVNVDNIRFSKTELFTEFIYSPQERPIVAQLFGIDPKLFYDAVQVVCLLGFDGIDINMGCPSRDVAARGAGAGMIKNPDLALEIIKACKKSAEDFYQGKKSDLHPNVMRKLANTLKFIKELYPDFKIIKKEEPLPVSVKTRIGYSENEVQTWLPVLASAGLSAITIHGRTLKQMYTGTADWDAIKTGAELIKKTDVIVKVIGNGDITSSLDVKERCRKYGVDGYMAGRAVMGNPAFFSGVKLKPKEKLQILLEQAQILNRIKPVQFYEIRKHAARYLCGFPSSHEIKDRLMRAPGLEEFKKILAEYLDNLDCSP